MPKKILYKKDNSQNKSEAKSKTQKQSPKPKRKIFTMIKLIFVYALAVVLIIIGIVGRARGNFTLGTIIVIGAGILLLVYGIFHKPIDTFTSHGFGRVLKYIIGICLIIFLALLAFVAVSGYQNTATGDEPIIIVLGAGLQGENVGTVLRYRLDAAYELWEKEKTATIVVSGGKGHDEVIPEALAMQRYLLGKGVPESLILLEDQSTSTQENLEYTLKILEEKGYSTSTPIALVTNAFHCYRARQYALRTGFTSVDTVPSSMALLYVPTSYSREVFAILYYWVFKK